VGHKNHYAALRSKDAIVDHLRERFSARPSVDPNRPDTRIHLYMGQSRSAVSIELLRRSMDKRGYRATHAPAPLRENLAAALLLLAEWPEHCKQDQPLFDPMCGSATLLIEGAWMALDVAPALLSCPPLSAWNGHRPKLWQRVIEQARQRASASRGRSLAITGCDASVQAIELARQSIASAGLSGVVKVARGSLPQCQPPDAGARGLLVTNPPYGARLGNPRELLPVYQQLGDILRQRFAGWTAFVLSGNPQLTKSIGLRPARKHVVFNGALECRWLELPIADEAPRTAGPPKWRAPHPEAEMFANRLAKNLRRWSKWARRENVHCYRVYDADIPEYNVSIDLYDGPVVVHEYNPPPSVDATLADRRLRDVLTITASVLEIPPEHIHLRVRMRHRERDQYGKIADLGVEHIVREGPCRFITNLSDYLDTGLFLEQRPLRAYLAERARGGRLLNLFCYTATATVRAALEGARASVGVDRSSTYLRWARSNLDLNGVSKDTHRLVRADCREWLASDRSSYDAIFMAPPTLSRMRDADDLQLFRDHADLIDLAVRRLHKGGTLVFSTHARDFVLDPGVESTFECSEITTQMTAPDFARSRNASRTWCIRKRERVV
jgi:23S rRNA (guanine2445-N2)-methyltransferase / 23S rRNA (guanine2069-N7)-methyltransferase